MIPDGYTDVARGKIASVVTYLEMLAPPVSSLSSPDSSWTLRRHSPPDVRWYRALFRAVGEPWMWFSRLRMDDEVLRSQIEDPRVDVFAFEIDGVEQGLLELDRRPEPDVQIAFIGLMAGAIGRGAGRFLLSEALRLAWSQRPQRVLVHTCTLDHPRALGLYRAAGFVPYKCAIEIADDPRLDGTLPRSAAPHCPIFD